MENDGSEQNKQDKTRKEWFDALDQRLDVETIAQMVEQMSFSKNLSKRLQATFGGIRRNITDNQRLLHATQKELRDVFLDVELLKRAITSLGQIGVMERKRIEKELILELFPPGQSRPGMGVTVHRSEPNKHVRVDCISRWPICKGACCRILNVFLSPEEIVSGRYEWDTREPYALVKNRYGCIYQRAGGCSCSMYSSFRPVACSNWSCAEDRRIWADFDKRILNPKLEKRLEKLDVDTSSTQVLPESLELFKHSKSVDTPHPRNHSDSSEQGVCQSDIMLSNSEDSLNRTKDEGEVSPDNLDSCEESKSIEPPDFSELREMFVPEPKNKFVPPETLSADTAQRTAMDNSDVTKPD